MTNSLHCLSSSSLPSSRNLPDLLVGATGGAAIPSVEVVEREEGEEREEVQERRASRRKRKHSPEAPDPEGPVDPLSDLYAVLEGSALVPFLETKLQVPVIGLGSILEPPVSSLWP